MIKVLGRGKWTTCKWQTLNFKLNCKFYLLDETIKYNFEKKLGKLWKNINISL